MKKVLLCFILIILIGLLLLPPGLRLFGKNLYNDVEEEKKDVVTVLNCKKGDEVINMTYFNDKPYDFRYTIKGNYNASMQDVVDGETPNNTLDNAIIEDIKGSSMINYSESKDTTEFHIVLSSVEMINEKLNNYIKKPEEQQKYYKDRKSVV